MRQKMPGTIAKHTIGKVVGYESKKVMVEVELEVNGKSKILTVPMSHEILEVQKDRPCMV